MTGSNGRLSAGVTGGISRLSPRVTGSKGRLSLSVISYIMRSYLGSRPATATPCDGEQR